MNQICPKGYFWFKTETLNIAIKFCVFENWSNLDTKFQLKLTNFDFFGPTLPKRVFLFVNKINEHHYWVLYIEIGLTMKFQPKLTILIFWTKFAKKRNLRSKQKYRAFACVRGRYLLYKLFHTGPDRLNDRRDNKSTNFSS